MTLAFMLGTPGVIALGGGIGPTQEGFGFDCGRGVCSVWVRRRKSLKVEGCESVRGWVDWSEEVDMSVLGSFFGDRGF